MSNTSLMISGEEWLSPLSLLGMRALYHLQQSELLIADGEERSQAMFTQGAMNDIDTLCVLSSNLKPIAPGGSDYYNQCVEAHALATVRQIAGWWRCQCLRLS